MDFTGEWEGNGGGESSGWGAGTWDQLGDDGHNHYEEFENIIRWDDSGALDAFETAKKLSEERSKGWRYSVSLPSPDLYIQTIDWDSHEDLKLPDPGGTFSPPKKGQRKRGRRNSGGFRRQCDMHETSHEADWKQSIKPFSQTGYYAEEKTQPERERGHTRGAPMLPGSLDSLPRAGPPSELQLPMRDQSKSNWSTQWTSPYQKQSSNWHGYGRSHRDGPQNVQSHSSQHRWRPMNPQSEQARGWGHGGEPYWSPHGLSNEPQFQANPIGHVNDWMPRQETSMQSFTNQPPPFHFSSGSRQQQAPSHVSDKTHQWRPQQQPNYRWQ
ncbi:hypothetical protein GOP47_0002579 [Adiantum capillus-veneris]|uniref:Uncharacterized protein n=1 Tax=Adiantum capillus-veneris TaxID=13818 RepID=A0A9D4VBV3_ADICA|nr:hypothetical protein GOP47_0002579 [Adiantum capillus-veneris]